MMLHKCAHVLLSIPPPCRSCGVCQEIRALSGQLRRGSNTTLEVAPAWARASETGEKEKEASYLNQFLRAIIELNATTTPCRGSVSAC